MSSSLSVFVNSIKTAYTSTAANMARIVAKLCRIIPFSSVYVKSAAAPQPRDANRGLTYTLLISVFTFVTFRSAAKLRIIRIRYVTTLLMAAPLDTDTRYGDQYIV